MNEGPNVKGNPLRISVYLLIASYVIGEFFLPKYPIAYAVKLVGIICFLVSIAIFFAGFNIFKTYDENPVPTSATNKIIKTGIFAYTRNPIYFAFVLFHLGMFMLFENVMYFLSSIFLSIWIHNYVIKLEERFLLEKFPKEFPRYMEAVKRWIFF